MTARWEWDDINAQHEDQARAERQEWRAAIVDHDPRDDVGYPDAAELAREDAEIARAREAWIAAANRARAES